VIIAARVLGIEEAFATRAARLVDDNHRLLGETVLADDALHGAGHLIGAAAGASGDDDFDRMCGLPRLCGSDRECNGGKRDAAGKSAR
jgi:hypothetical protein